MCPRWFAWRTLQCKGSRRRQSTRSTSFNHSVRTGLWHYEEAQRPPIATLLAHAVNAPFPCFLIRPGPAGDAWRSNHHPMDLAWQTSYCYGRPGNANRQVKLVSVARCQSLGPAGCCTGIICADFATTSHTDAWSAHCAANVQQGAATTRIASVSDTSVAVALLPKVAGVCFLRRGA